MNSITSFKKIKVIYLNMSKIIGKILIILGLLEFALAIFYQPLIHKYSSSLLCIA